MIPRTIEFFRANRILTVICITTFILMTGQSIITPVLPLYAKSFGLTATMIGVVVGVFGVGRLLVNVPVGYVAERYGRRVVLIGGLALSVVSALLTAFAPNYGVLVVLRFFSGIGSAMYVTGAVILITDITAVQNRAKYLSWQEGSLVFGSSVGPVIGGFAADLWGLRAPFLLLAGLCAVACVLAWNQVPSVKAGTRAVAKPTAPTGNKPAKKGIWWALVDPAFFFIGFFGMMIFFTRTGGRGSIVPLLATSKAGLSATQLGIVFTVNALVAFLTMVPAGVLSDRFGRKVVILPAALVTAGGLVLFVIAGNMLMYVFAGFVLGLGIGIAGATPPAWAADISRAGNIGVTMGLYRTFGDFGNMIGPVLLGWIADRASFESALLVNAGLVVLIAIGLLIFGKESVKRRSRVRSAT